MQHDGAAPNLSALRSGGPGGASERGGHAAPQDGGAEDPEEEEEEEEGGRARERGRERERERERAVRLYLPRQLISYSPYVYGPPSSEYEPGVQPATERLLTLLAEGLHPVTHWAWVNHARHGPILLPNTGETDRLNCVVWHPPL